MYDLVGITDVASLAMHAVGEIDLKSPALIRIFNDVVNLSRAKAFTWVSVFLRTARYAMIGCESRLFGVDDQVAGLMLIMR